MPKCWFKYKDGGPAVGPFFETTPDQVHDKVMDMANSGVAPKGRPGKGDLIAFGERLYELDDFDKSEVMRGHTVKQMAKRWEDGPTVYPRGDF